MQSTDNPEKRNKKIYLYLVLFVMVCIALSLYAFMKWNQSRTASQNAEELDALLTREHGNEATEAVEHFEQIWMSLEMHKDPKPYYDELLTGPLLQSYLNRSNFQDDNYWLIPSQTDVDNLVVVDYGDRSMRVVACINEGINKVDHYGAVIEQYPLHRIINFYVFVRDGESWKIGNVIDITDPKQALQDWDFMPQDLKDITGDIDSFVYKSCKTKK